MIEIFIDEIDLLTPPFANDDYGELCGGKISSVSLISRRVSNLPAISGVLRSAGIFDEAQSRNVPMTGMITSKIFTGGKFSIKPILSGILKSVNIVKEQLSKSIPAIAEIKSRAFISGRISICPLISGALKTVAAIGCGEFEAHICGGVK